MSGDDSTVSAGPTRMFDPRAKTSALAALRQATWEATQYLTDDEVWEFVGDVLREVESDQP